MYYKNDGFEEYRINSFDDNVDFIDGFGRYGGSNFNVSDTFVNDIFEIAKKLFDKPKMAKLICKVETKLFFDEAFEEEMKYYIIGDLKILKELESNDNRYKVKILKTYPKINFDNDNTIFLFNNTEDIDKYQETLFDLELNKDDYNFRFATVGKGLNIEEIVDESYSRAVDIDSIRAKETLITEGHLEMEYDNVLIEYQYMNQKFDFAFKRSINVLAGQSGNLKSTFIHNLITASINDSNDLGFNFIDDEKKDGNILLFDTETNEKHLAQKWKFYTDCSDRINYYTLKSTPTAMRMNYVKSVISDSLKNGNKIRMIIIDSLMDFIEDFNCISESHKLVEIILDLTEIYNIPIFVTYQENPARFAGASNKLSGHLGTMLHQKCESHYQTSIKRDEAKLACKKNRNEKQLNLSYDLDTTANFIRLINNGPAEKKKKYSEKKLDILRNNIDDAFSNATELSNNDMELWIMSKIEIEERAASDWKSKMNGAGIIERVKRGRRVYWIKG